MIRTKFQKFNFHAVVSPSTFIRKMDTEIKDNEIQISKEKSKRKEAEIKTGTHKKLKQINYVHTRT
jgi:hypothetical protein